jgi:hypothetical protein
VGQWLGDWRTGPARQREGVCGEENWRRQAGPTGQRAMEGGRARGRSACQTARARGLAGPTGLVWAAFSFSFSLNFLIPFPFLFL